MHVRIIFNLRSKNEHNILLKKNTSKTNYIKGKGCLKLKLKEL